MYDVIGDIHGHYDKFEQLMQLMGYQARGLGFVPPQGRKAVFVGDLIDRGPEQLKLLAAIRAMVDAGDALVVMGNHEFNAIAYITEDPDRNDGECLRPNRSNSATATKNRAQHAAFLAQVGEGSLGHRQWVDWFKALPLHLDLGGIRVAHAWWDEQSARLTDQARFRDASGSLTDDFMVESHRSSSALKAARKILTTGHEVRLPPGHFVTDKEGHKHDNARLKMWLHEATHLHEIAIVPGGDRSVLPDITLSEIAPEGIKPVTGAPIFIGHYWYSGPVRLESSKVAVLDWSAAKGGPLVAYRWEGESTLSNNQWVSTAHN